ncbi:MAG: hypothetical protein COB85_05385 [Bacteroidetes bacterium]|nr:MAG: hypothetical protein COB85_05385 [Bacteroidota bacterium]
MIEKGHFLIAIFIALLTIEACKKEYPNDIPGWVKEDIQNSKRKYIECPSCMDHEPQQVDEYYEPNYGIVYGYTDGALGGDNSIIYYATDKYKICVASYSGYCNTLPNFAPEHQRLIYQVK